MKVSEVLEVLENKNNTFHKHSSNNHSFSSKFTKSQKTRMETITRVKAATTKNIFGESIRFCLIKLSRYHESMPSKFKTKHTSNTVYAVLSVLQHKSQIHYQIFLTVTFYTLQRYIYFPFLFINLMA